MPFSKAANLLLRKSMKNLTPIALAISLFPLASIASESTTTQLDTVVVTADRQAELLKDTTSSVQVFTRADIDRLQPSNVAQLLARVPGIQITQAGGIGSSTGLFIRGTAKAQTLVLIDGVKINGADSGAAELERLNVDQIDRIEVVKGSRSVVYGADALGGVVQIFTRRGEQQGINPRVRLAYGSNETWERSIGVSGGNKQTRFNLSLSKDDTHGINRTFVTDEPADLDRDGYENRAVNLKVTHELSEEIELGFNVSDQRGESEFDQDGNSYKYPYSKFQISSVSAYADVNITQKWFSHIELSHLDNRNFTLRRDNPLTEAFNTYRNSLAWVNDIKLRKNQDLTLGADYSIENLSTEQDFDSTSRWNRAVFAQHEYFANSFSTKIGVRHDDNEAYGNVNTFSGALTIPVNQRNTIIASYNEGFRAPTFVDLYAPAYPGWPRSSNPDLKPEESKNYEIQWRSDIADNSHLQLSLYRSNISQAIIYDGATATMQNAGSVRIDGFEAGLQQELFGWISNVSLSIMNPRNRDTGEVLVRRAKRTLNIDLDRKFGEYSAGATWSLVSRAPGVYDPEIAGRGIFGLRGAWTPNEQFKLDIKIDNLLNKSYVNGYYSLNYPSTDIFPYREPGRTAMLAVTWTPKY
jgi:vitamin B12 transporter